MTPPLLIDEAHPSDLDELLQLERRCASHPWTASHFLSEMDAAQRARVLTLREMDPGGMLRVVGFCAYRLIVDEVHVHNLAVAPERRRRGLGRTLLRTAITAAGRSAARWALLEVRAGNEGARRLYEGEGFAVVGRRRGYYADPVEDALVLRRALRG